MRQGSPRLAQCELPTDWCAHPITRGYLRVNQSGESSDVRSALVQALARQRGGLDFSHVQPASMLERVMGFEPFQ